MIEMKINKFILLFSSLFICFFPISSCSLNRNKNEFIFLLTNSFKNNELEYINLLQEEFDKNKKNTKYENIEIKLKLKILNNNQAKIDSILNGIADFCYLPSSLIINNNLQKKISPYIQTYTTSFKFDSTFSEYIHGMSDDPLREIANNMQNLSFGNNYSFPFKNWKDQKGEQPNYDWNGNRYNYFYNQEKLVDFYRGMIVLSGPDEKINKAIEYWEKKDWNSFRNLGIILGDANSYGSFKLQENLISNHFNLKNFSFQKDMMLNSNKYITDLVGGEKIGKNENFIISFLDEGSFAWTHNFSNINHFNPINNWKIKILTVTNPMKYDIGCFRLNIDKELLNLVSYSIINLHNDIYGPTVGYNGYKIIENFNKEVYDQIYRFL